MSAHSPITGRHVVFLSWRDLRNPEGGGAELYLHHIARGLVERGAVVTVFCAAHDQAPPDDVIDGVRYLRRGSKMRVYGAGFLRLLTRRFGRVEVVVDVQNGLPFFTRLATRKPVVVLVHHVHREQWPVVYPGLIGKVGWWIESRLAPRLYRDCQYVAVSRATRRELVDLGVGADRIAIVHNGVTPVPDPGVERTPHPSMCLVSRLVPHKQVEHAIDAVVRLREEMPDLTLTVVGSGWWEAELHAHAEQVGAGDSVIFTGHVTDAEKHAVYARSWVMALPSLKEGWGLVIGEAGLHATPAVAYASAGGTQESIIDDYSGLLAEDWEGFVSSLRLVLSDAEQRAKLAAGARTISDEYTWEHAQGSFAEVLAAALDGRRTSTQDPNEIPAG